MPNWISMTEEIEKTIAAAATSERLLSEHNAERARQGDRSVLTIRVPMMSGTRATSSSNQEWHEEEVSFWCLARYKQNISKEAL